MQSISPIIDAVVFDVVVSSDVVGFAKPRRRIFELAAEGLRMPATRILHVGDDFDDLLAPHLQD